MRILWHSVAPWCPTGYGNQTSLFAPRINKLPDVDLAISCGFGLAGYHLNFGGMTVYPSPGAGSANVDWNQNVLQWTNHHKADLVITLMDVWPLDKQMFAAVEKQRRLACWCPVDHKPAPTGVIEFFQATGAQPISMSRFGEQELREAGLDPLYVPHGVDTDAYAPIDRTDIRQLWNIPEDAFVVGMVANNQGQALPRKAFSEAFAAFSLFQQDHPDAIFYLHTEMSGFRNGLDLDRLIKRSEINPENVKVTDQVLMDFGIPSGVMAGLYNVFDVLLHPSYGEGFGIPIIEAQACGTPVIVTDWTSMPELVGAGWTVDGTVFDHPMAEAYWKRPDVPELVSALEAAFAARGDDELRAKAREFALQYDADHVLETYWKPVLETLSRPREVQPLRPNRAARRAAKKAAA